MKLCYLSHYRATMTRSSLRKSRDQTVQSHRSWHKKNQCTVKSVLSGYSKRDKTEILMTNGSLMEVESIA